MGQEYIREGKRFLYEESGIGVVEIILILVVLVGLIRDGLMPIFRVVS